MGKGITFIGLDVHKEGINVAMLLPGETRAVEWQVSKTEASLRRLVRKLGRVGVGEFRLCYEAGPCGYTVQRTLRQLGLCCLVVAPSLVPRKPGDRVKTDRRDARKLAELLRGGLLTEVYPPTEADEAVRDLCRARGDAREDLVRGRHRVSKLLLRHGRSWTGGRRRGVRGIEYGYGAFVSSTRRTSGSSRITCWPLSSWRSGFAGLTLGSSRSAWPPDTPTPWPP